MPLVDYLTTHASQLHPRWRLGPQRDANKCNSRRRSLRPTGVHAAPFVLSNSSQYPETTSKKEGKIRRRINVPAASRARGRSGCAHSLARLNQYMSHRAPTWRYEAIPVTKKVNGRRQRNKKCKQKYEGKQKRQGHNSSTSLNSDLAVSGSCISRQKPNSGTQSSIVVKSQSTIAKRLQGSGVRFGDQQKPNWSQQIPQGTFTAINTTNSSVMAQKMRVTITSKHEPNDECALEEKKSKFLNHENQVKTQSDGIQQNQNISQASLTNYVSIHDQLHPRSGRINLLHDPSPLQSTNNTLTKEKLVRQNVKSRAIRKAFMRQSRAKALATISPRAPSHRRSASHNDMSQSATRQMQDSGDMEFVGTNIQSEQGSVPMVSGQKLIHHINGRINEQKEPIITRQSKQKTIQPRKWLSAQERSDQDMKKIKAWSPSTPTLSISVVIRPKSQACGG